MNVSLVLNMQLSHNFNVSMVLHYLALTGVRQSFVVQYVGCSQKKIFSQ